MFALVAIAREAGTLVVAAFLARPAILRLFLAISSVTLGEAIAILALLLATWSLEPGAAEFGAIFASARLPPARDIGAVPAATLLAFAVIAPTVRSGVASVVLPAVETRARSVVAEGLSLAVLLAAPERPLVAVAVTPFLAVLALAGKTALGEFPFAVPRGLGAVLAMAGPITPAAP